MKNMLSNEKIMEIKPYKAGESKVKGVEKIIKLSSNEGAFGPSPKAVQAYKNASINLHRYPDGGAKKLIKAIANKNKLDENKILCGAGSDEIIGLICSAFANNESEVLYNEHGFLMYSIYAKIAGATPKTAKEENFTISIDNILKAVNEKTKIVFIANPNNPTSTYVPKEQIKRLRQNLRDDILLVIDAAYAEFVVKDDYDCGFDIVDEFENTIVLRTFSKIYALGGIRLGWCYADEKIIDILNRVRSPFNVSSAAQEAGVGAINDDEFIKKSIEHNQKWLKKLKQEIPKLGFEILDSVCNFVLITFNDEKKSSDKADEFLRKNGIIARKVNAYGLEKSLRVTIGTDEEMEFFLEKLTQFSKI